MKALKYLFLLLLLLVYLPICEARRVRTTESYPGYTIDENGVVYVDGKTLFFPDIFEDHAIVKLSEGRFVLLNPDGVVEFYVDIEGAEGEIDVVEEGLLEPLSPGEDRLQFASEFVEQHTVDQVKSALFIDATKSIYSDVSEEDWQRLTRVANKYTLERLQAYFEKLNAITTRFNDSSSMRYAIPFLLDIAPNPEYALDKIESMPDAGEGGAGTVGAAASDFYILSEYKDIGEYFIERIATYAKLFGSNTRGVNLFAAQTTGLEDIIKALESDVERALRFIPQFLMKFESMADKNGKAMFNDEEKTFLTTDGAIQVIHEIANAMDLIFRFSEGDVNPIYRFYPFAEGCVLIDTPEGPTKITLDDLTKKLRGPKTREVVAVEIKDSEGEFSHFSFNFLDENGSAIPPFVPLTTESKIKNRFFYIGNEDSMRNIDAAYMSSEFLWGQSFIGSDLNIRLVWQEFQGVKPYQVRLDKPSNEDRFELDLDGDSLGVFWKIIRRHRGQVAASLNVPWEGHHYELKAFNAELSLMLDSEKRDILERLFLLICPLPLPIKVISYSELNCLYACS